MSIQRAVISCWPNRDSALRNLTFSDFLTRSKVVADESQQSFGISQSSKFYLHKEIAWPIGKTKRKKTLGLISYSELLELQCNEKHGEINCFADGSCTVTKTWYQKQKLGLLTVMFTDLNGNHWYVKIRFRIAIVNLLCTKWGECTWVAACSINSIRHSYNYSRLSEA